MGTFVLPSLLSFMPNTSLMVLVPYWVASTVVAVHLLHLISGIAIISLFRTLLWLAVIVHMITAWIGVIVLNQMLTVKAKVIHPQYTQVMLVVYHKWSFPSLVHASVH
jgi:hypothetical protein